MLFKKVFYYGKIKGNFCAQKSKEIASLMNMCSTLKIPWCIAMGVLAIICSNSFSHCKGDLVVVVVDLLFYVHGKHLRSCRDGQLT